MGIRTDSKTTYSDLVARLRNGEVVKCVIDFGTWKGTAAASYVEKWYGDLFELTMKEELDYLPFTDEKEFMGFCAKNRVVFDAPMGVIEVAA